MNEKQIIDKMVESIGKVPDKADILEVHHHSLEELEQRAKRFLSATANITGLSLDRGNWQRDKDQTRVLLPRGSQAVIYHASGAMHFSNGFPPMEKLFKQMEDKAVLQKQAEALVDRLKIRSWISSKETLQFERLWQIKAAAADKAGKRSEPVLCRAVGAFRHFIGSYPVLGAASCAIQFAGDGSIDTLSLQVRESKEEKLDQVSVIKPEIAASQFLHQMGSLLSRSKASVNELVRPEWMRFGYFSLSKRKTQRVLAPVYMAALQIEGQQETPAYVFAINASDRPYLPLQLHGSEAFTVNQRNCGKSPMREW